LEEQRFHDISILFCPKGEILKRVQDDKSVKFQIVLARIR